jgi:CRISPR/Cas system-associated exonuclease Cas4 (RecB family)
MRTIRASEIGAYFYCQRAWWYQKSGVPSEDQAELAAGNEIHTQHGRQTLIIGCVRTLGYLLLFLSLTAFVIYLTNRLF